MEADEAQDPTPEEVTRINMEHETLAARSVEDLIVRVTETNKLVMSLEVWLNNRAEVVKVIDK